MKISARVGRVFWAIGYISLFLQWLWLIVLVAALLLANGSLQTYIQSHASQPSIPYHVELPELLRTPLVAVTLVSMVLLSVYFMFRAPRDAGHLTVQSTERLAKKSTEALEHRLHVPKAKRLQFGVHVLFALQIGLSVLALGGVYIVSGLVHGLAPVIQQTIAGVLCLSSVIAFSVHVAIERHVQRK